MKPFLTVLPCPQPYLPHIVRYKNSHPNMSQTFAGMVKGQSILVRLASEADRTRIQSAANNAKVRIEIAEHPTPNMVRVTSLGRWRERVMSTLNPGHVQRFKTRHS